MNEHQKPESTQELPISSVAGFAEFIINDRGGELTESHLESIFAMQINKMIKAGELPTRDELSEQDRLFYRGKAYQASETVRDSLDITDMGGWGANYSTVEEVEEFIEEQADLYKKSLVESLKEVHHG